MTNVWIAILVAAVVSYAIRVLPLTLIRRPIENVIFRSFLYYVPYVTLAVMTFPAIIQATDKLAAGIAALVVGVGAASSPWQPPAARWCSCWSLCSENPASLDFVTFSRYHNRILYHPL